MRTAALALVAAALSACTHASPDASVTPTPTGMSFEALRAANSEYVDCVKALGATVTVQEVDDFGVPDVSNDVAWPKLPGQPGDADHDAELAQDLAWDDDCASKTVNPVRQAYWASGNKSTLKRANFDKRWDAMLPQVRDCFAQAGAYVDPNTTRDELVRLFNNADDNVAFSQCLIDAGLVTQLGGGGFQLDS